MIVAFKENTRVTIGLGTASSTWASQFYILKLGNIWYKREVNNAGSYFSLHYSNDAGGTWDTLFTLDITEANPVIDLAHAYRHRIVGTAYHVDRTLTLAGYAGTEDLDWENIYTT